MATWICPVIYVTPPAKTTRAKMFTPEQVVKCGPPFDTSKDMGGYHQAVKMCIVLHGFRHVGWGGVIYRDWPVDGRVLRFYMQGGGM